MAPGPSRGIRGVEPGAIATAPMSAHEAQLWQMADALRNNMDAAEYKHVVLGLIFLKYISDAFEEKHAELEARRRGRRSRRPRRIPRRQHLLGAQRRRAGLFCKAKLRSRRSVSIIDDAMRASNATIHRSRACCPRTSPAVARQDRGSASLSIL